MPCLTCQRLQSALNDSYKDDISLNTLEEVDVEVQAEHQNFQQCVTWKILI